MNTLTRKNDTYTLDNLPEISSYSFLHEGKEGFTGSIVKRPLLGNGPLYHYAFIYGFDLNGQLLLIENNENGVECVTWTDFISDAKEFQFVHFEKDYSRYTEIMRRAAERSKEKYLIHDNNCEHFANYSVHNNFSSFQADTSKKIADSILSIIEINLLRQSNPIYKDVLKGYEDIRKQLNLERKNDSLQKMIDKSINNTSGA